MRRPAMEISSQNVRLATRGALDCAKKLGIASIAFPVMGTGVGGVAVEEAAEGMVDEINRHVEIGTSLKRIMLVGFNTDLTHALIGALETLH
jgi:O-acetyl-ADP-ribose deacetylase (regulator of RNase III)